MATYDGNRGWPRPRALQRVGPLGAEQLLPTQYMNEAPQESLLVEPSRMYECYDRFLCTVCGLPALQVDPNGGWLIARTMTTDDCATDSVGGAACTRCAYLAQSACPKLKTAVDSGTICFWIASEQSHYTWQEPGEDGDESPDGHGAIRATKGAQRATLADLFTARKNLRRGNEGV